jgi:hypothetical protein
VARLDGEYSCQGEAIMAKLKSTKVSDDTLLQLFTNARRFMVTWKNIH